MMIAGLVLVFFGTVAVSVGVIEPLIGFIRKDHPPVYGGLRGRLKSDQIIDLNQLPSVAQVTRSALLGTAGLALIGLGTLLQLFAIWCNA